MQERIFSAFLAILGAVILLLLPLTDAIYAFRTDLETDTFVTVTGAAETTANVTLAKSIYDNDTSTLAFSSNASADNPSYSSYNVTSHTVTVSGLAASTTRLLTVSYDIDALDFSTAENSVLDRIPFIWMVSIIGFPPLALVALWLATRRGRVGA